MKIVVEVDGVNPCDDMPRIIGEMLEARSPGIMVSCCDFDDEPMKQRIRELEADLEDVEDQLQDAENENGVLEGTIERLEEENEELQERIEELEGE